MRESICGLLIEEPETFPIFCDDPRDERWADRYKSYLGRTDENPIRTESLPPNILDIARLLLERGAAKSQSDLNETLALVSSGRVPREAGVQDALIEMLCAAGAQPDVAREGVAGRDGDRADSSHDGPRRRGSLSERRYRCW